jgi:hypothetical protein
MRLVHPHCTTLLTALALAGSWPVGAAEERAGPAPQAQDAVPSPLPPGYEIADLPDLERVRRERIDEMHRDVDIEQGLRRVEYRRTRMRSGRPTFSLYDDYY